MTSLRGRLAEVAENHITFLKIQFSFKCTWFQGSKPIIKGARAQNGPRGSIVSLQHHRDLKGLTMKLKNAKNAKNSSKWSKMTKNGKMSKSWFPVCCSLIAFHLDRNSFPDLLNTEAIFSYQFLHSCQIWLCSRFFSSKYGNISHLGTRTLQLHCYVLNNNFWTNCSHWSRNWNIGLIGSIYTFGGTSHFMHMSATSHMLFSNPGNTYHDFHNQYQINKLGQVRVNYVLANEKVSDHQVRWPAWGLRAALIETLSLVLSWH